MRLRRISEIVASVLNQVPEGYRFVRAEEIGPSIYFRFRKGRSFLEIPERGE